MFAHLAPPVTCGGSLGWLTALDRALDAACAPSAVQRRTIRVRAVPMEVITSPVDVCGSAQRAAGIPTGHDAIGW
jgi:hypothetical protein